MCDTRLVRQVSLNKPCPYSNSIGAVFAANFDFVIYIYTPLSSYILSSLDANHMLCLLALFSL